MIHLRSFTFREEVKQGNGYPFHLPLVQTFEGLEFQAPVVFFVGENGSGKSTLMEAIACSVNLPTVGAESVKTDPTLFHIRELAKYAKVTWSKRVQRGFYLRAEDFFGYAKQVNTTRSELEAELRRVDSEYANRSRFAYQQARTPFVGQLSDIEHRYGNGLDAQSHGESFLKLFQSRFVPGGLYLLDEPEVPLSPLRQLSLLSMLREMEKQDAQFIIATHSPILMAYPGAIIYNFDRLPPEITAYDELEHVKLTRDFLANPNMFLRHL